MDETKNKIKLHNQVLKDIQNAAEHRVAYHSVKIPLILMFKELLSDKLIAMHTAPNQRYTNIVERILSLLDIYYQNMVLERKETEVEKLMKKCYTHAQLRQKSELKDAWEDSLKNILSTLQSRTERMALKGVPFKTLRNICCKTSQIHRNSSLPTKIASKKLTHQDLKSCEQYQSFLKSHCNEGEYAFQVRRCNDVSCCSGKELNEKLQWLPTPVPDDGNPGH